MAEPTIPQVFGTDATRLASGAPAPSAGLFIPDSVFVAAGLSTPTTASAEAHLVALAKTTQSYLTQTNFEANIDQSIYWSSGFPGFTSRGTEAISYRTDSLTLNLAKIDTAASINPSDY